MLKVLVKSRISSMMSQMSRGSKKNKPRGLGFKILIGILAIYVVICLFAAFAMLFFALCEPLSSAGLSWFYFAIAGILTFALSFIGSVFMTQSQIYDAKDNDLLLSMPIKPSYILFSRLIAVFAINCIYGILPFIPACVIFFIFNGFSILGLIIFIIAYALISILAMTFSCIVGWLIALISSKLRNKNIITVIFSALFLVAYFYIYSQAQEYLQILIAKGTEIAEAIRRTVFPIYYMGNAMAENNLISLLIFTLCALIPAAVVYIILSKSFIKITTSNKGIAKKKYQEKALKVSNADIALTKKELKHFFSNPMYIFNASLGSIFMIILPVALIVKLDSVNGIFSLAPQLESLKGAVVCLAVCALASMNFISAPSISLEGKNLWIAQSIPVPPQTVLMAKVKAHIIVCLPPVIFACAVCSIAMELPVLSFITAFIAPTCLTILTGLIGVVINLRFPRFDWINETIVIKQGASVGISMFAGIGIVALGVILCLIIGNMIPIDICILIYSALLLTASFVLYRYLKNGGTQRFMEL